MRKKKLNRGLILALLIIILVGIYLGFTAIQRAKDKKEFQSLLVDFFTAEAQLISQNEELESKAKDINQVVSKIYQEKSKDFLSFVSSNEISQKLIQKAVEAKLISQAQSSIGIKKQVVRELFLKDINYYHGACEINGKIRYSTEFTSQLKDDNETYNFRINLAKEDGKWKVTFFDTANLIQNRLTAAKPEWSYK